MARKSRWQQFTDNFNGVYDTFNKLGQNIEAKRIMGDDFTAEGGAGAGLSGADLERARYKALGDVYTKYGNAEAGLNVRNQLATLEAANRENDINNQIMDELIAQRGLLTSNQMRADTNQANSSAANNYSLIDDRNATRPYRLEGLRLGNESTALGNVNQGIQNNLDNLNLGIAVETRDSAVQDIRNNSRSLAANADTAESNARVSGATEDDRIVTSQNNARQSGAVADSAETEAEVKAATSQGQIDATNTSNDVTVATNNQALSTMSAEDAILADVMALNLETPEATQEALLAAINNSQLPIERRIALSSAIQTHGLETLMNKGQTFTQEGLQALGKGLDAGVAWYDTQDDGNTLEVIRENGTVRVMERRGDAINELYSASGPEAEQQVIAHLSNIIKSPTNALAAATSMAEIEATRANTDRTNSQTTLLDRQAYKEILNQDLVKARNALLDAQVRQIDNEIGNKNLTDSSKVAQQGLQALMRSEEYMMLGEVEGGADAQAELRADYMRSFNMEGAPPLNVPAREWFAMTEEERATFN